MVAQIKVHVCRLGLLLPSLNASPVYDESATEGGVLLLLLLQMKRLK